MGDDFFMVPVKTKSGYMLRQVAATSATPDEASEHFGYGYEHPSPEHNVKCQHCGKYGGPRTNCLFCGAPIDPELPPIPLRYEKPPFLPYQDWSGTRATFAPSWGGTQEPDPVPPDETER